MSCVTCHVCDGKYIWWLQAEDVSLSRDHITLPSQILSTVTTVIKCLHSMLVFSKMTKYFHFQCYSIFYSQGILGLAPSAVTLDHQTNKM